MHDNFKIYSDTNLMSFSHTFVALVFIRNPRSQGLPSSVNKDQNYQQYNEYLQIVVLFRLKVTFSSCSMYTIVDFFSGFKIFD